MIQSGDLAANFNKYAAMIRLLLQPRAGDGPAFVPQSENATDVQVERGGIFASAIVASSPPDTQIVQRLLDLSAHGHLQNLTIVDRSGHHRPVYRGLLVYSWLRAFGLLYEMLPLADFGRWEDALRPWCDLLEAELGQMDLPGGPIPAGRGSSATESAWIALALHAAGKIFVRDAWTDLASDTFGRLGRSQSPGGAFLLAGASDNPETHWYHELVLLHAAASYAVQTEDRPLAAAVARNTQYHQEQTQPDHATAQPWGLFAFIWNPRTRQLADQLLHAVSVQNPQGIQGVSLMLLADTLYCLELFTR